MFLIRSPNCSAPWNWARELRGLVISDLLATLLLCCVMAGTAQARVWVGFGFPLFVPPLVVGPPAYYPPYYYGPPPGYPPPGYPQAGYPQAGYPPSGNTFSYSPPGTQPQSLAPPAGYAPPPGYPPQGGYGASGGYTPSMGGGPMESAQSCQAGAYVCPLVQDTPPGGPCSCPGHGGNAVRGQAN
jgi:hypothetical protein